MNFFFQEIEKIKKELKRKKNEVWCAWDLVILGHVDT